MGTCDSGFVMRCKNGNVFYNSTWKTQISACCWVWEDYFCRAFGPVFDWLPSICLLCGTWAIKRFWHGYWMSKEGSWHLLLRSAKSASVARICEWNLPAHKTNLEALWAWRMTGKEISGACSWYPTTCRLRTGLGCLLELLSAVRWRRPRSTMWAELPSLSLRHRKGILMYAKQMLFLTGFAW